MTLDNSYNNDQVMDDNVSEDGLDDFYDDDLIVSLLSKEYLPMDDENSLYWDDDYVGASTRMYYKDVHETTRILTEEEELHYANLLNTGSPVERKLAEELLIKSMLRYVIRIAKMYTKRGLEFEDLLQEGNLGLITAIQKFDPKKGRLSTYSTWWIRQRISRAVMERGRTIKIPSHAYADIRKYLTAERNLETKGIQPSDDLIAHASGLTVEQVRTIKIWIMDVTSLDTQIQRDGITDGTTLMEFIEDPSVRVDENLNLKSDLKQALDILTEKERTVLILRFGLDGYGSERKLQEVGKIMGFTRERARQIEHKALMKLKRLHQTKHLIDYLIN